MMVGRLATFVVRSALAREAAPPAALFNRLRDLERRAIAAHADAQVLQILASGRRVLWQARRRVARSSRWLTRETTREARFAGHEDS